VSSEESNLYSQLESSSNFRNNTFLNPIISYDFKCGHYLGIWDKLYPSLITSFIEQARGIRKSSWIFSDQYQELLKNNYSNYFSNFTSQMNLKLSDSENWYSSHVSPMDNYFNFYYNMNLLNFYKDSRWMSFNSMDQKFYKMFNTASTQQRILANWRQLKFTREAWRCKLLAARHQNTMYRRYSGEESYFW
jgi:hypothetical protein